MADAPEIRGRETGEAGELISPSLDRTLSLSPTQFRLPDWREIAELEDWQKIDLLQRYGITPDWVDFADAQAAWLGRVASIPPESGRWQQELETLVDTGANDVLDKMCRRAYENYTTALAVDGDPKQLLIRISEEDDAVCDECDALAGEIGTYAEHQEMGLPGAASCLGGDRCRCTLVAID